MPPLMALADRVGEQRINTALKQFLKQYQYVENGYPTTLNLMAYLSDVVPPDQQGYLDRSFREINMYDLRMNEVDVRELPNGEFEVTLTINAGRVLSQGPGSEEEVALDEQVQIALSAAHPIAQDEPSYLQMHNIVSGENKVKIVVPSRPGFATIDPYIHFIDLDIENNTAEVE